MTPSSLPSTMVSLRDGLFDGQWSVAEVIAAQEQAFRQDRWHCVVRAFPASQAHADVHAGSAKSMPLFAGVGVAHKDMFLIPGHQPACGAARKPFFQGPANLSVQRLTAAGAPLLGTLAMAEFAAGITAENPHTTTPINPLDESLAVGGSSSGSAVAVSSGLCYGSLGTDTAGSIRVPAATCGILGLVPTHGTLSGQGCFPLAPSLDTIGLMTRSALDALMMFSVCLGEEGIHQLHSSLKGLLSGTHLPTDFVPLLQSFSFRVGMAQQHPDGRFDADEPSAMALTEASQQCQALAVSHLDIRESMARAIRSQRIVLHAEAAATHYRRLQDPDVEFFSGSRALLIPGMTMPVTWYIEACQQREAQRQQFVDDYLRDHDIILMPVLPFGVPPCSLVETGSASFNSRQLLAMMSWTGFVNYLGLPAITVPISLDDTGAPVCVQVLTRPHNEIALLAFAHQLEQRLFGAAGFVAKPPAMQSRIF